MSDEAHEKRLGRRGPAAGEAEASPVAAATVILLRDSARGLETLMLRRNSKIAFGGMWVFPGGRVDEEDRTDATGGQLDEITAARRAAVREAREEAGLVILPDAMVPYSHWTPPRLAPRRFRTWFFIAEAPAGDVAIDQREIHEHAWMRPADALERRDAGDIELAPPTWVTLHELSARVDTSDALANSRAREPEHFETRVAMIDDRPVALWHGDAAYDGEDATKPGPRHRLWMRRDGWRYERTT